MPNASQTEDDEIEIDIDALDVPTLRELQRYVKKALSSMKKAAKAGADGASAVSNVPLPSPSPPANLLESPPMLEPGDLPRLDGLNASSNSNSNSSSNDVIMGSTSNNPEVNLTAGFEGMNGMQGHSAETSALLGQNPASTLPVKEEKDEESSSSSDDSESDDDEDKEGGPAKKQKLDQDPQMGNSSSSSNGSLGTDPMSASNMSNGSLSMMDTSYTSARIMDSTMADVPINGVNQDAWGDLAQGEQPQNNAESKQQGQADSEWARMQQSYQDEKQREEEQKRLAAQLEEERKRQREEDEARQKAEEERKIKQLEEELASVQAAQAAAEMEQAAKAEAEREAARRAREAAAGQLKGTLQSD
jgi:hypothetical protein